MADRLRDSVARALEALQAQARAVPLAGAIEASVGAWKRAPGDHLGLIGRDGAAWALTVAGAEGIACKGCDRRALVVLNRPLEGPLCCWCWRDENG